jgi:hypothetical protein
MSGSSPANDENPPQSPFCLSLTEKKGRLLLLSQKGSATVQSFITLVNEVMGP